MKLLLKRKETTEFFTEGDLYVNGEWFCFTLEDTVRHGPKVYGQTAIPAGHYKVAVTYSNRFKREMTQILDVPDFQGIRIHQGLDPSMSLGCPLISKKRGATPGHLAAMKARVLTDQLTELVRKAGGAEITVVDG